MGSVKNKDLSEFGVEPEFGNDRYVFLEVSLKEARNAADLQKKKNQKDFKKLYQYEVVMASDQAADVHNA